jgi:hypothetical protein
MNDINLVPSLHKGLAQAMDENPISTKVVRWIECCEHAKAHLRLSLFQLTGMAAQLTQLADDIEVEGKK